MQLRPEFFDVYLELAVDFRLPLRMAGASAERLVGFPYRRLAAEEGVVFPDHFVFTKRRLATRASRRRCSTSRPGVTEVYLHPAHRHRRAARVASRLAQPGRGLRVPHQRPVVSRSHRTRRRHAHRLPRRCASCSARDARRPARSPRCARPRCRRSDSPRASSRTCASARATRSSATSAARPCSRRSVREPRARRGSRSSPCTRTIRGGAAAKSSSTQSRIGRADSARAICCWRARSRVTSGRASTCSTRVPGCCSRRAVSNAIGSARTWRSTPRSGVRPRPASSSSARPAPVRTSSPRATYPYWVPELDRAVDAGYRVRGARRQRRNDRVRLPLGQSLRLDRTDGNRSDAATRRRRFRSRRRSCAPTSSIAVAPTGEISWVSNLRFYGKCGAHVSRVFLGGKLALVRGAEAIEVTSDKAS